MASTLRKREEKKYPSFSRDLNKLASQTRWTFLSFSGQMIHPYFSFSQLDAGTALVPTNLLLRPVHLFSTPHRTFLIPALFRDKTAAAEPAITQDRKPHLFFSIGLAVRVRVWCYVVSYSYVPLLLPSSYGEFQHEKEKKEENNFFLTTTTTMRVGGASFMFFSSLVSVDFLLPRTNETDSVGRLLKSGETFLSIGIPLARRNIGWGVLGNKETIDFSVESHIKVYIRFHRTTAELNYTALYDPCCLSSKEEV